MTKEMADKTRIVMEKVNKIKTDWRNSQGLNSSELLMALQKEPPLYVNVVKDNPYVYGDPVREESAFYGRKRELDDIINAVTKSVKQDILLVGERRTGKTSLLYQLEKRLEKPFIPVYIVLNTAEPEVGAALDLIIERTIHRLVEKQILPADKWNNYHFTFSYFIDRMGTVLDEGQKTVANLKVILLVDEADYLLRIDDRLQNILRATLQSGEVSGKLRAVVTGTSDLSTYVSTRSSPFFNHFRLVPLKPLSREETENLITNPATDLGYTYEPEAIERIVQLCGGHPYYCQRICYEAFRQLNQDERNRITPQDVEIIKERVIEDCYNGYLSGFWERMNRTEKKFIRALIKDKAVKHFSKESIKRLIDWQLITQENGDYSFQAELFKEWSELMVGARAQNGFIHWFRSIGKRM